MLEKLLQTASPSGYEHAIIQRIKNYVTSYVDVVYEDALGNLICRKKCAQSQSSPTIMFVAHADEVGLMVSYIEESGYIRFTKIGGVDLKLLSGRHVKIIHDEFEVPGVIGAVPIHMKHNSKDVDIDESDLWIDIGILGKENVEKHVSIGDSIVIDSSFAKLPNNLISSRGCDNKAGIVSLLKVLEIIQDVTCCCDIVVVFSVQEEIGLRGARIASYAMAPDICVAVDVTHATDYPSINKAKYGDVRIGGGPVIPFGSDLTPLLQKKLQQISQSLDINYQQVALSGNSGTDINAAQISRSGCATGLISIPCRYMHTPVEIVSLDDIEKVAKILSEFCKLPLAN